MTLRELQVGHKGRIVRVGGEGALRQHFLDMGIIPDACVRVVKFAPMGDPMQLRIHGYELTLRLADAECIEVELSDCGTASPDDGDCPAIEPLSRRHNHPGLGEMSPGHATVGVREASKDRPMSFALAGNQNCGKTTLFNQLTGMKRHVGNFPGLTVDTVTGDIRGHSNARLTDLPGVYSLSPYSMEETVTRRFILEQQPDAIINIVDGNNIERNLYLTMQLMELNVPMVLAVNMMDEVRNNGGSIRINQLEALLGIPVVPISAIRNEGVDELMEHALHVARYQEAPLRQDFCAPEDHNGAVHRCLHAIMHLVEDHAAQARLPLRFAAGKLIEGDSLVREALKLDDNESQTLNHILQQMERERGLDPAAAMAEMRYAFIERVCRDTVVRMRESREHRHSVMCDRVLTGRWTALPLFAAIMALVFWTTFDLVGGTLQSWLDDGIASLTDATDTLLTALGISPVVHSLVVDGILTGVGAVASFVPVIVTLFLLLSLLEDSGYMARVAFVTDKLLRKIGLSGRSIVPMLMGFGCSVPSVMASRTLPSERDRRLTVALLPFMSCTAKLPIYAFFTAAFFPRQGTVVMIGLYLLGVAMAVIVALLLKHSLYRGEAVPFVMELPNYRMPGLRSVVQLVWDKARDYLQKAFTVIFIATIVIWFMRTFNLRLQVVGDSHDSLLAMAASCIAPLFEPLGFGDWRMVTSLISGFMAKESVVSTLSVLCQGTDITGIVSTAGALSFLVFCLLYTPCVATVAMVRREMGGRYSLLLVVWQCLIAWLVALAIHTLAAMLLPLLTS